MNHSMKKILLTTLVAIHCSFIHATNATSIIPAPAQVEEREGHFQLTAATRIQCDPEFKNEARPAREPFASRDRFPREN